MRFIWKVVEVKRTENWKKNDYIGRGLISIQSIEEKLNKKKLEWVGHLLRMSSNRQVKKVREAQAEGQGSRKRSERG